MSDVTIVCCYNNETMYNNFVNTLKAQTCPYELIGIDNRGNGKFTSCAAAYNSVIDDVKTKYVIYSHQDIELKDSDSLAKFISYLERIKRDDILGVAGVKFNEKGLFSNIKHIDNKTGELIYPGSERVRGSIMECDVIDECFFGGYTEHFRTNPFNESLCDNWHLYAVEACLKSKSKCLHETEQNRVYVCDVFLVHTSDGLSGTGFAFYHGFYKLCRYYRRYFPFIRTTCASSKTGFINAFLCWPRTIFLDVAVKFLKNTGLYEILRKILRRT